MTTARKIVFAGSMGAGKTTSIAALSEIPPVTTEAVNHDRALFDKDTTTVALDYGEFTLDDGSRIQLIGTPGQLRFDFMWRVLANGALGVILLVDNSRPAPLDDVREYLRHFRDFAEGARLVIGVGRTESHPQPTVDAYADLLAGEALLLPVLSVDVRRRDDVLMMVHVLLSQLEACT
ncbi:GTP-binding protein [Solimonas variicoloris]|uniref:GTP-binding protein n=1 Tax=Solimonas variicoloris TaxID=254408 RepID=UPI000585A3A9|nr:ATP/GTP-binding protein [Solimonas variicoloris]